MKGSLIIIGFFVLGTLCGIFHLIPVDAVMDSKVSFYALCALMFSVENRTNRSSYSLSYSSKHNS